MKFKPIIRRLPAAALLLLPMTIAAENWTRFSPGGEFAVQCTTNGRYLANTLCLGGEDQSFVRLVDEFDETACTWVLNDEGDGDISVRNTQGGLNEGDYIRFDSKIRLASTVNFTDYLKNQTFQFYRDADAEEAPGGVMAVKVKSQGSQSGWWKSRPAGDELGYEPTHTLETATVFLLIPVSAVEVPDYSATKLALTGDVSDRQLFEIRDNMFKLRELDLSATSLTSIPARAFSGMSSLTKVYLPAGLKEIGDAAFLSCAKLNSVELPASLERIGSLAFAGTNVRTVALGAALTEIGKSAWSRCPKLRSITVDEANTTYSSTDNLLLNKEQTSLILCPAALNGTLVLPETLRSIENYACEGCTGLSGELSLPAGLTEIGDFAFANCTGLSGELTLPAGLTAIGRAAFYGDRGLTGALTLPQGLPTSGSYGSFAYLTNIEQIGLPATATAIAPSAFEGCGAVVHIKSDAAEPPLVGTFGLRGIGRELTYIEVSDAEAYRNSPVWEDFDNYSSMPRQFERYATDGDFYIATSDDRFLTFTTGGGAMAILADADDASCWSLEFTDFTDPALTLAPGKTTDMAYVRGSSVYHINMEGKCFQDPADGYARNKNRTFAFWYDAETESWAIQSNGYIWTYDEDDFIAEPYTGRQPLDEHFVWKVRSEKSGIEEIAETVPADGLQTIHDLTGRRLHQADRPGIYIINGVKTLVKSSAQ